MQRTYFARGERRTVDVSEDVVPVKISSARGAPEAFGDLGRRAEPVDIELPAAIREAFEQADWRFVAPVTSVSDTLESASARSDVENAGKLARRDNGRFGIVTRRLCVQLTDEIDPSDAEQVLAASGLTVHNRLRFAPNLFEVDTTAEDSLSASVELHDDPNFVFAEPSFIEEIPVRMPAIDPRSAEQWQWHNTGQQGGTPGADVRATQAWAITHGSGIRVAVIDNGFNTAHEDLTAAITAESGFFRTVDGVERFVPSTVAMPPSDHGTFCAGIVGARSNTVGGSGAAPACDLTLIACLNDQVGDQTTLARAVAYAADPTTEVAEADPSSGADIIVSSLGPNGADWDLTQTLSLALEFAASTGRQGRGTAIFWAASNGRNVDVLKDEVVSHRHVIAVVRSTNRDLEDNAARGPAVDLIAPGVQVLSTTGDGGYGFSTGTSFAAPCAAGCAALALSVKPDLTAKELEAVLRATADKVGAVVYDADGHNDDYGFGRVNAFAAVRHASELPQRSPRAIAS